MNALEKMKQAICIAPQLADNTTVNGTGVMVADFSHAAAVFTVGATDIGITTLKLQESDDNSTWSDVTGKEFTGSELPADTDDNKSWLFTYNVVGGKKYIRVVATVGDGTTGAYIACNVYMLHGVNTLTAAGLGYAAMV